VATTYRLMPRQQPKPEAKKTSQSKPSHGNGDQTAQRRAKKTNAIAVAHTLGLGLEKLGGSWMVLTGLHSTKSVAHQVLTNVAIDSNMDCPISFRETFSRLFEPKNYLLFHFE